MHRLSLLGVAERLVVMALIWFGWSAYAWLGNQARADEGLLRVSMFLAMAGYFRGGPHHSRGLRRPARGLRGPVVFVVAHTAIDLFLLVGALLGIALVIAFWRTHFNEIALRLSTSFARSTATTAPRMARDTFTYLHLRPVIGIVEMAVGLRAMLDEVVLHGAWIDRDVPGVSMLALYGGAVVYLLSLSCLRWRARGQPSIPRLILAASLAVLAPDRGTRMRMATLETAGARGTAVSQSTVVTSFDLLSRVWSVCGR